MVKFENGNIVITGAVTAKALEEAFDIYNQAKATNERIESYAVSLAKAVLESDGAIQAIKEVYYYVTKHPHYVTLGKSFGLKEAKEIVDRLREQG
jgi:ribosomal protein L7/L12